MKFIVFFVFVTITVASLKAQNATKFQRRNVFLSRRKRYVQWPKGSNFVINFTCSKPLLRYQPLTWNTVYEMDVPFADPPDNKIFFGQATKVKRHILERKNLLEHLDDFMTSMGLNGRACINRLICESKEFIQTERNSMVRDLIRVLFGSFLDDKEFADYEDQCEAENFTLCSISLLSVFLNSSNKNSVAADNSDLSLRD